MSTDWSTHLPSWVLIPIIVFLQNLLVALLWKYLVLLSPLLNHKTLDLWFHILDSLSNKTFISPFNFWIRELFPLIIATLSATTNCFFFSTSSLRTFPKILWFHQVRSFSHCATCLRTLLSELGSSTLVQAASTSSPHLESDNYICAVVWFWNDLICIIIWFWIRLICDKGVQKYNIIIFFKSQGSFEP